MRILGVGLWIAVVLLCGVRQFFVHISIPREQALWLHRARWNRGVEYPIGKMVAWHIMMIEM
jgi:hypothetical protein